MAMELYRRRMRSCLLVVMVVLVMERTVAKPGDHAERGSGGGGSARSLPAEQPGHDHDHDRDHDHQHDHDQRQAQRAKHATSRRRPHAKQQPDVGPEPRPRQHTLGRADEGAEAHDLLDCEPQPGDLLLGRSVVRGEFQPLAFAEASWFFPQSGRDDRTIHCVRVLDQRRDGHGGYPRIVRGGVGHHFVELAFKSDFSRGFHFVVEVYGQ